MSQSKRFNDPKLLDVHTLELCSTADRIKRKSEKFERSCCISPPVETVKKVRPERPSKPVIEKEKLRETQKITVDQNEEQEEEETPKIGSCHTLQADFMDTDAQGSFILKKHSGSGEFIMRSGTLHSID